MITGEKDPNEQLKSELVLDDLIDAIGELRDHMTNVRRLARGRPGYWLTMVQ